MIHPRGVIEVNGIRADFDPSRAGGGWEYCWRSEDPLLEAIIRQIARRLKCLHQDLTIAAAIHITKVAEKLGGRVVSMHDCGPIPEDYPESWIDECLQDIPEFLWDQYRKYLRKR
ncbi:MAG: hypothetical protein H5U08_00630 [Thermogutta sp.]|uniref:hypothetical protein n=1 Tax=Thermogutta sp. TaxID=1962930 RepID=UPI00199AF5DC|nr:hypothetical protein [Thermogutta sp.]MBC7350840.1 hypothetical protein [Thermogutta sp.]